MHKSTTESFIEKAIKVHGNIFDYSLVEYKTAKVKVIIKCKVHGEFLQTPNGLLNGYGCKKCSALEKSINSRGNVEDFIRKANKVHEGKYLYDKAIYTNSKSHLTITCKIHGDFTQAPSNHLAGQGCRVCGYEQASKSIRKDTEYFIRKAREVHGDLYDYSNSVYTDSNTKVSINCRIHGEFKQNPTAHVSCLANCPKCKPAGYISSSAGYLYIASNSFLTKIGITNKHPSKRILDINRSGKLNFKLEEIFHFEDGNIALETETKILRTLHKSYEKCQTEFNGNSECFYNLPVSIVTSMVTQELLTDKRN